METVVAEVTAPVDAPVADAPEVEPGSEGSAPSVKKADTSEDTSSWTEKAQKRYDELTRRTYEALGERDRERYQREALEARLAELEKAKTDPVAPDEFPTLEKFGYDEAKFNAAVAAHYSKIAREEANKATQEQIQEARRLEQAEKQSQSWAKKEAEFIKSKPDYVEKVKEGGRRGEWKCTDEMAAVIRDSDVGPQVAYHLAENPEKAAAIAGLPPLAQAREIGRIEAAIEAAKNTKPAVSQAPPPVQKVDAADAPTEKSPIEMSDAEFAKWRKRQIAQRRNS